MGSKNLELRKECVSESIITDEIVDVVKSKYGEDVINEIDKNKNYNIRYN